MFTRILTDVIRIIGNAMENFTDLITHPILMRLRQLPIIYILINKRFYQALLGESQWKM